MELGTDSVPNRIAHESRAKLNRNVGQKLARDFYWDVFEPLETEPPEPVGGMISDDLSGIWSDVKEGLLEFDQAKQTSTSDAIWHWRDSFETHWARHAVAGMAALNALCFGPYADPARPTPA